MIRPELRTYGGEVAHIVIDDEVIGKLTLVFAEGERLSGSLQLDEGGLAPAEKRELWQDIEQYLHSLKNALRIQACDIHVSPDFYEYLTSTSFYEADELEQNELMIVDHSADQAFFLINRRDETIAEASLVVKGRHVQGDIRWHEQPDDYNKELALEMVLNEFDDDIVDTYFIEMKYRQQVIETYELLHEELLEDEELAPAEDLNLTIELVREDEEAFIYDIYAGMANDRTIARATIDLGQPTLSGTIDFSDFPGEEMMESVATALVDELEEELEFERIHLTIMYNNECLDEYDLEYETS